MPSEAREGEANPAAIVAPPRLFSPREADRLVPHLEATFAAIGELRNLLADALAGLEKHGIEIDKPLPEHLAGDPEVVAFVDHALAAHRGLRDALVGLEDLGVEVKALDGLVDVHSRFEGRLVCLCWKRGETAFNHWHELEDGYAGRVAIANRRAFEGSFLH